VTEARSLADGVVLITGGTGTFGEAAVVRLLAVGAKEIRIFSRDEKKQDDMRKRYRCASLKFYLGDVRSEQSLVDAMAGVDYVFHAAALKQVPSCEFYPLEALRTNALGAANVLDAAMVNRVKTTVVLSTDKAVYPINAMGITKAMMEKLMVAKSRVGAGRGIIFCGTRYGNVMGSRGSVIPLFISQIKEGRPLTITDPHMTRFMMSIEGAIDLVLYAFEHAQPGDIFVKKAPGATVDVLARALVKLFKADNPIQTIGTRHGEKKYESLLTREERARAEDHGEYYRVPADGRNLDYELFFSEGEESLSQFEDYTSDNTEILDLDGMTDVLLKMPLVQRELETWRR
jgi:UDP-N-acetylglucosamine 4,6-dehydratase/5-epimerase